MWGKEIGKWVAGGHTRYQVLLLSGRMFDLYGNGIYAMLSEDKSSNRVT